MSRPVHRGERTRTRVLLVDDSEASRVAMRRILEERCAADVVGAAPDGEEALRDALRLRPDLVLLDLQMPRMDGFTFLRVLMARAPVPVVVVSSQSRRTDVFKALELGALDFVAKPEGGGSLHEVGEALVEKLALLRCLRIENLPTAAEERAPAAVRARDLAEPARVVAIGASTGGPQAIQRLLAAIPGDVPAGFVVAQHMPERFTGAFAERLARTTPFSVQEAADGDVVAVGRVLVAPGGRDLEVVRDGGGVLRAALRPRDPARKHCPSVDRLFESVARALGSRGCAVVLTGMGQDGCEGARQVRSAGGLTIAESDETAVVYGMPHAAAECGGAEEVLPLPAIAARIARFGSGS